MQPASESIEALRERVEVPPAAATADGTPAAHARRSTAERLQRLWATPGIRFAVLVYLGSRVLLIAVAVVNGALRHHALTHELANWDGLWYRQVANQGYPTHVAHAQTPLGFFPLYPMVIWTVARAFLFLTAHSAVWSITVAGIVVSTVGGLVAAVLVLRLAAGWWGERAARRAVAVFCLFPGSVIFSMVYAEGIVLPLAIGCIFALERHRWVLAGVLAGLATAGDPEALILVPVCAISAGLELRRQGWHIIAARRSLLAPLLSLTGVAAFGAFLWAWTGSPFATMTTQHYGWHEKTDPLAVLHLTTRLAHEFHLARVSQHTVNLNLVVGLAGAILLVVLLAMLFRSRREVSVEAMVWTLGISFLAVTSEYVPPNPRLLFTAFPAVMVLGRYLKGRAFGIVLLLNGALLGLLSALTFVGVTLRP